MIFDRQPPRHAVANSIPESPAASTRLEIDAELATLASRKEEWANLEIGERIRLLDQVARDMRPLYGRLVSASLYAKRFPAGSMAEAEEWINAAAVARLLRLLRRSLVDIRDAGRPRLSGPLRRSGSGQVIAPALPLERLDRLTYYGISGEVWMEPGVTEEDVRASQARRERERDRAGAVALVLGAGNVWMIPMVDTLHKLFVEGQVVALKPNPVNAYIGPLIEQGFRSLTHRGFLRVVYGGVSEGAYLTSHPSVDELHLTGSAATFEVITFGPGEEGRRRKRERDPVSTKRFTAELGNISPVIVVPGPWADADLDDQAEQVVTWLVANAGFGCLTPRVLVQHRSWPLRGALNAAIERHLARVPSRNAYYPGAHGTHAAFVTAHPDARRFGSASGGNLPWTFIRDVDPAATDDICFTREPFCGLMSETALEAADAAEFVERATAFANETLWGSLVATMIVHPASMRDERVSGAVERAISGLRYGAVTVNMASVSAYYLMTTPWGAFPGHDAHDIQSGTGKTSNALMFDRPEKSVVQGPFRKRRYPLRVRSDHAHQFTRALAAFEARRSPDRLARLLRSVLLAWVKT